MARKFFASWVASFWVAAAVAGPTPSLCYVPGVGGLKKYASTELGPELTNRHVPYILFKVPTNKPIQEISQSLCRILETEINLDSEFRCHFFGYSMGGVMLRYAINHLTCTHSQTGVQIPFRQFVASLTTAATPHRGTPVADLGNGWGFTGPEAKQVGEEGIVVFNEPKFEATYSPLVSEIPTFSFESYIQDRNEASGTLEKLGFDYLKKIFRDRGVEVKEALSDGVVPTASQGFGAVLGRIRVPHGFFGAHGGSFFDKNLPDFLKSHWDFLNSEKAGVKYSEVPNFLNANLLFDLE